MIREDREVTRTWPYEKASRDYLTRLVRLAAYLSRRPALNLSVVSIVSLLTYLVGLVLPYNLFTLGLKPLLNIAKLTRGDLVAQVRFVVTIALLSGLYYVAWRICRGHATRRLWLVLLIGILTINLAMLFLYPIGAADIFDNIIRGRITAQYQGNPFYEQPIGYKIDPFYIFVAWPQTTSAYGPLWELLAALTSHIAGDHKLTNVLVFKSLALIFYFGCIALIAASLNRHAPERALQGVCLFGLNPLVVYATAGNGHNDIVMVFFIVLAMHALGRQWFTLAAVAATAGALIKFVPALLLPIIITAGLRAQPGLRGRARYLIVTLLICVILIVATYAPFWQGGDPLAIQRRAGLFTSSLPAVIQAQLESSLGVETSRRVVANGALLLTGVFVLAGVWRTWVESPNPSLSLRASDTRVAGLVEGERWLPPVRASAFVLLAYLLFSCLWFQPWYTLWPLALAALLPEGESGRIAVLLSYAAAWKTIIFDFFLVTGPPLPPRLWRETLLGPATLGLAWLYSAYAAFKRILHSSLFSAK